MLPNCGGADVVPKAGTFAGGPEFVCPNDAGAGDENAPKPADCVVGVQFGGFLSIVGTGDKLNVTARAGVDDFSISRCNGRSQLLVPTRLDSVDLCLTDVKLTVDRSCASCVSFIES